MSRRYFFLISFLLMTFSCQKPFSENSALIAGNEDSAIVNGQVVTNKDVPFSKLAIMLLGRDAHGNIYLCTGSLIRKDLILTAAHCAVGIQEQIAIFSPNRDDSSADRLVVKKQIHLGYISKAESSDKNKPMDDIAILKINASAPAGYIVLPLLDSQQVPKNEISFLAAGYGSTTGRPVEDSGSGQLRVKTLKAKIKSAEPVFVVDQAAGGVCSGDSGGPAVAVLDNKVYVAGVAAQVSYFKLLERYWPGYDSCKDESIYTNVAYYSQWIKEAIKKIDAP